MSKFIKRIGTTASKYMVEFGFTKVELNLVQPCKISIILKRGDHVEEMRKPVPLEKGVAQFDEKLGIPATLYFDKKKNNYITKEASITINVITAKVTRLAGVLKVDLAEFANNNVKEQDFVRTIDKCFDKTAKVHFKIRMVKVSDIVGERKSHRKAGKDKKEGEEGENRDRSESPFTSQINADSGEIHDYTDNSDVSGYDKRDKSPDFKADYSSDGEQMDIKSRSRTADVLQIGGRRSISEDKREKNKFITEPALSEITAVSDSVNQSQKLLELEVKARNYQRENKELYDKIREDNEEYINLKQDYEDLKSKYDKLKKEYESLSNGKQLGKSPTAFGLLESDSKVEKNKITDLERQVQELKKERDEANERADELQQNSQDLLVKIETLKKDKKNKGSDETEEHANKIKELQEKLKAAENTIKEMTQEKTNKGNNFEIQELEIENSALKKQIEAKDAKIEDFERQLGIQTKEIELLKKMNSSAIAKNKEENNQQAIAQIEQMEKKQKALEDTYKKKLEELTKQNGDLKKELEQTKSTISSSQFDTENELAKLSLENENLKRQIKEFNGKLLNVKYDNKDVEDMRKKIIQLEADKEKLESELMKAKMGWATSDKEKEESKGKLKSKEEEVRSQKEQLDVMEIEVFKLRSRMAELMNVVMEFGEMDLLDKIEAVITEEKKN